MKYKDYYKILGITREASTDEIKRAYRKQARRYHPDVSKAANAEERFKEVGEAYEVLKDTKKRQAYDQLGSNWKTGEDFTPPPNWNRNAEFDMKSAFGDLGNGRFSDFFESIFNRAGGAGFSGQSRPNPSGFTPSQRHHTQGDNTQVASITIPLEDAYLGVTRSINLQSSGVAQFGQNAVQTRTLKVNIPKGVMQGSKLRLAGQGVGGGDLYLKIKFQVHPLYRVDDRDIYLDLPVTPWELALGTKLIVPSLGGKVELNIPPGSQGGQKLRLKARGLPGKPSGDQYVVLQVIVPKADTPAKKTLYEQMKQAMPDNPRAGLGV